MSDKPATKPTDVGNLSSDALSGWTIVRAGGAAAGGCVTYERGAALRRHCEAKLAGGGARGVLSNTPMARCLPPDGITLHYHVAV